MNETHVWRDTAAWHQLLCLLPLLVVTNSVADAVAISVAVFTVLVMSNVIISTLRGFIPAAASFPAYMLLIGLCTTTIMMLMQVYAFDAHQRVALFVRIVLCNCIVLAQAEHAARQYTIGAVLMNSIVTGAGFLAVLILVSVVRESLPIGLPASILPACVFFVAGLMLAARNALVPRA